MKLPHDPGGVELARALARQSDRITHQTVSHIRLTLESPPEHHLTIPARKALRIESPAAILAQRHDMSRKQCPLHLFDRES